LARGLARTQDHHGPQPHHCGGMDLRNARLAHAKHSSNFFHGQFLEIVKDQDLALLLRQFSNGARQLLFHFSAQAQKQRGFLRIMGHRVTQIFLFTVEVRLHSKTSDFKSVDFTQ